MRTPQKIGADVRPIEGVWGADRSAPHLENVAPDAGTRGGAAGGKPRKATRGGKTQQTRPAQTPRQPKKKERSDNRCADRRESPKGAGPPARRPLPAQEPDKGNRPTRAAKQPEPNDESVTPNDNGQRDAATDK